MLSKSECRDYINDRKPFLNISSICRELGLYQSHVSKFLKTSYFDECLTIEKANAIVDFIERL